MGNVKVKISRVIMCMVMLVVVALFFDEEIYAAPSGKGTSNQPYKVSKFDDLEYSLTTGARKSGKTYILVSGTINMKKNINVDGGSFCIYAGDTGATIRKSIDSKDDMNDKKNPRYCIRAGLTKTTSIEIGCQGSGYVTLGGQRKYYESNKKVSSGWLFVGKDATVTLGGYTVVQNMINNDSSSKLSNLSVYGYLYVDCEIKNCKSLNGGAICVKDGGVVELRNGANINNCVSETEGGAIWVKDSGYLKMDGTAKITSCSSNEEGGAIFVSGNNTRADILSGTIAYNKSGNSAGGVFAGYGATLIIGATDASGPTIERNTASGSGGGVRANGGLDENAGGNLYFYSGRVNYNTSKKYGGGISIGTPGKYGKRYAYVCNAEITGNQAEEDGGGICIPKGVEGEKNGIVFKKNQIKNNYTKKDGGGIYANSSLEMEDNYVLENEAGNNGGGIYIGTDCKVSDYSGHIGDNRAKGKGKAIYLAGMFHTGGTINIYENNEIYICKDKYIENDRKYNGNNRIMAKLDSAQTNNGTKLVHVGFSGGTGEKVLYGYDNGEEDEYRGQIKNKKFEHVNLSGKQLLRSTGMVRNMDENWIIISNSYTVKYIKNISQTPKNMPDNQTKFYEENLKLTNTLPELETYEVVQESMWNDRADGKGKVYSPGSTYEANSDLDLYAIWKWKLIIDIATKDRYYVVGQDITLSEDEVLKKVSVTDNCNSGYPYKLIIKKIYNKSKDRIVFEGNMTTDEKQLEKYLSTKNDGNYQITLYCENSIEKKAEKEFTVYILPDRYEKGTVRFISNEYLGTLDGNSVWRSGSNYSLLINSLRGKKKSSYRFSANNVKEIRNFMKKTKYKMDKNMTFYIMFLKERERISDR